MTAADWTTPADLKARLVRLWDRGDLLRSTLTDDALFPLRLALRRPTSADVTEHFGVVRSWAAALAQAHPLRVEWQEVRHRVQGVQRLPVAAWVDTLDDVLRWIGHSPEAQRFFELVCETRQRCPDVMPWVVKRPMQALELQADWTRLLDVVNWVRAHPRPAIYLRQVDLPGVHSKFIEAHRAVLSRLLDLALPADCMHTTWAGNGEFAPRYGFLQKPLRVRFRPLDPDIETLAGVSCPDLTLDADSFSRLRINARRVIITENEINFLALPRIPDTLAIFGSGYGWDALARATWLQQCTLYYWGDIDTHGFAILDQLRGYFPQVTSILMNRATLDAHQVFWGQEATPHTGDLHRLTPDEQNLYDVLRDNRIRPGLRLEQEHLGYSWVAAALQQALHSPG